MKIKTILLAFFLTLISVSNVMAADPCPPGDDCGEPLPGAPIDQNIIYLLIGAVVLGFVIINKNKIKKASV